jgi:hypothetical protein
MAVEGTIEIEGELLNDRDSIEIEDAKNMNFKADGKVLLIEVPLH